MSRSQDVDEAISRLRATASLGLGWMSIGERADVKIILDEIDRLRAGRIEAAVFATRESPKPFRLYRSTDHSGVSGTGVVADGVQFTDGTVAIRWLTEKASTVVWASVDDAMAVHGHNGDTSLVWTSEDIAPYADEVDEAVARAKLAEARATKAEEALARIDAFIRGGYDSPE